MIGFAEVLIAVQAVVCGGEQRISATIRPRNKSQQCLRLWGAKLVDQSSFSVTEDGRRLRDSLAPSETFITEKEESFLLDHRAAERPAKFIDIEFGIAKPIKSRRRVIEERSGVQYAVAEKLKHIPVKLISAGFADGVDD